MKIQRYLQSIRYLLQTTNTQALIIIPLLVGLICFGLLVVTGQKYIGEPVQNILISLGFLFWAISGIPKIVRQESIYGPIQIFGKLAVIDGIVTILLSLVLASIPIFVWGK